MGLNMLVFGFRMIGLLVFFWSAFAEDELQVVGADNLPANVYFNCSTLNPNSIDAAVVEQARQNCINTGWCIWQKLGDNGNTCVRDECLKPVARADIDEPNCPEGLPYNCTLHYITDVRDCGTKDNPGTGAQTDYADLYCRIDKAASGYDKLALDKCFYDDMDSRPGVGVCGNKPCAWGGGSSSTESPGRYCRATNAQICADVVGDLESFCKCLGSTDGGKYCNLHPNCILNDQKICVEDLCTRGGPNCDSVPANQPAQDCEGRYERRIDINSGELETQYRRYCANKNKGTNANTCYWGLSSKAETWVAGTGEDAASCSSLTTVNKCSELQVYNISSYPGGAVSGKYCEIATIPSGWFAGTQICIDPGRAVPSISAGVMVNFPSVLAFLFVLVFFVV